MLELIGGAMGKSITGGASILNNALRDAGVDSQLNLADLDFDELGEYYWFDSLPLCRLARGFNSGILITLVHWELQLDSSSKRGDWSRTKQMLGMDVAGSAIVRTYKLI